MSLQEIHKLPTSLKNTRFFLTSHDSIIIIIKLKCGTEINIDNNFFIMYQSVPKVENAAATPTVLKVQVEGVRFQAYLTFWGMCLFAMICTKLFVEDTLGPCPLTEGAEPTYGLHCSALMTTFGFNNVSRKISVQVLRISFAN